MSPLLLATFLYFSFVVVANCCDCDYGWTYKARTHSCYLSASHPLPWEEAEEFCRELLPGSHLVTVTSAREKEEVQELIDDEFFSWIGLYRNSTDDHFRWTDDSPFNYSFFLTREPAEEGDCVAWTKSFDENGWKCISCNYSQFFLCETIPDCAAPQYLTEPSGEVKSDGHPKSYENNQYKVTYIEIELDQRVIVSVLDFDLDEEDSLTIYDGGSVTSRILIKWSGTHENQAFLSTSNLLTVVFRTDDAFYGRGFVIHYESWSKKNEFYHSSNDVIASPNYPDYYPFFTENTYLIDCPEEENRIIFNITDISISSNDYLSFFEGPSTSDNHILRINGNNPSTLFFRSLNGTVLITFTSEETRKRHSGWQLEYHCVPLDGLGEEIII